ncbi:MULTISPECIES: hypothetical protein [Bacillus]|uniref:Uncharacterized protein n=1 Tax=Bacillus infantis NRRL B-14911 TaxID=1367477 RepID=U5L536_9BACI|nr:MULTISPECIES: hypothetical protein [Bacillus]AGX02435.1 hypothetical protein N288_02340 [Bacillus infantis NRRL B-14911]MCP1156696.1 hypothetical protein [Bacillus infantis]MDT0160995.1 hypothetical protein [Bacillus sp. AG4(2022)]
MKKTDFFRRYKKDQSGPCSSRKRINTRYIFPKAIVLFISFRNIFFPKEREGGTK